MARFGRAMPSRAPTERRAQRLRRGADDYLATLRTSTPERYARASARAQAGEKCFADGAGQAWETCIGEIAHASLAVGEHSHLTVIERGLARHPQQEVGPPDRKLWVRRAR